MKRIIKYKHDLRWFAVTCSVVVVICLVLVVVHHQQRLHNGQKALRELRAVLVQNSLTIDSAGYIDPDVPNSEQQHSKIADSLSQNLKSMQALQSKLLDKKLANQLKQLTKDEQDALKNYQTKLGIVDRALAYNPSDDLGGLSTANPQLEELGQRVNAAKSGLDGILQKLRPSGDSTQSLDRTATAIASTKAISQLTDAKDCFAELSQAVSGGDTGVIVAVKRRCIHDYIYVRETINQDLVSTLVDNFDSVKKQSQMLITQLANQ